MGSTECHGAAQPLGEDTFLVTRMAEQVALKTGCTVAEPVWYGSHPYNHLGMPGTVVIPEDVFLANLRAIIAGFWNMGFRKQIFLNGHGQEEVIPLALHQLAKKYQVPCMLVSLHWPTVIHDFLKDKAHGGPFETPFQHACEVEASYSLALFPEFMDMELASIPNRKVFCRQVMWIKAVRCIMRRSKDMNMLDWVELKCWSILKGLLDDQHLLMLKKPNRALMPLLDYMVKLIGDIMTRFPAGQLPPVDKTTMRDPAEIDALLKGPLNGGKHIYTVAYPP